jgi:tetratricopeptide (TPR) repeat protein
MKRVALYFVILIAGVFLAGCASIPAQLAVDRGYKHAGNGDYRAAIGEFTEAINLSPDYHLAYANRGLAYYYLGEIDNAIKDFSQAVTLKPSEKKYQVWLQEAKESHELTEYAGGTLVISDIPAVYNGKYVFIQMDIPSGNRYLFGFNNLHPSLEAFSLVSIKDGTVNLPMRTVTNSNPQAYRGNDTASGKIYLAIYDTPIISIPPTEDIIAGITFTSIKFSNGNAAKSAKEGELVTDF